MSASASASAFVMSYSSDTFVPGGTGLDDDFDGTISNVQFTEDGPPGYNDKLIANGGKPPLFFKVDIDHMKDGVMITSPSWYSLGGKSLDMYMPSPSGYALAINPDYSGNPEPVEGSKYHQFIVALEKSGYEKSRLSATAANPEPLKGLVGVNAHWLRQAVKREGMEPRVGKDGRAQTESTLVIVKLLSVPGESAGGGNAGVATRRRGAAAAQPAAAAAVQATATVQVAAAAQAGAAAGTIPEMADADLELVIGFFAALAANPAQTPQTFTTQRLSKLPTPPLRTAAAAYRNNPEALADLGFAVVDGLIVAA